MTNSTAAPWALTDFPDRLSPMVVKELRQALRTRQFTLVLLLLHVVLVLITLAGGMGEDSEGAQGILEGVAVLVLCVVVPLRGFSAIADEIKGNTLESLVLTRLSVGRIVFGKWLSVASQGLLVALSMAPYMVARYVFGGSELFEGLAGLAQKWLIGCVLASVIICLSTTKQFWVRGMAIGLLAGVPGFAMQIIFMIFMARGGGMSGLTLGGTAGRSLPWAMMVAVGAWLVFYFLSLAATRIAPAASRLAVVKRVVHAGAVTVLLVAGWAGWMPPQAAIMAAGVVMVLSAVDALTEWRSVTPSVLVPFYRKGAAGRLAAVFLCPGWPNGVFYTLAMTVIVSLAGIGLGEGETAQIVWIMYACVCLCGFLVHLIRRGDWRELMGLFCAVALLAGLLHAFLMGMNSAILESTGEGWFGVLLPGTMLEAVRDAAANSKAPPGHAEVLRVLGLGLSALWPALLALQASLSLRRTRLTREQARAELLAVA